MRFFVESAGKVVAVPCVAGDKYKDEVLEKDLTVQGLARLIARELHEQKALLLQDGEAVKEAELLVRSPLESGKFYSIPGRARASDYLRDSDVIQYMVTEAVLEQDLPSDEEAFADD
eukprot:gb/GFBE01047044.1/.p1 GENE.gb/GFBE01047044.1/~~gb/GFBE01047044.1/.p1  ORF type:complete len:117 (+),score=45.25 gb/GFBE01047044.1/:1-351(+)